MTQSNLFDVDAILAVPSRPKDELVHAVESHSAALFSWDYHRDTASQLDRLYEKAKRSQWNANDLPWETPVDPYAIAAAQVGQRGGKVDFSGTVVEKWGDKEWIEFSVASQRWMLSQFLHGEQGALLCSARLVEAVPSFEMKLNGAAQTIDEARHVEVFAKYLDTKLGGAFQINAHLGALLDDVLVDSRWDMVYLGMQIMVEGLALAAFGFMRQLTPDPLLRTLLQQVMADEARHVAFGTLSLADVYRNMTSAELAERAEFAFEASLRMRDRFLQQEVWESFDIDPRIVIPRLLDDPDRVLFQALLFQKIVPNCRKLGLLDANDGWLRNRFADLGVIHFEHADATDTEVEAGMFELAAS